jgi:hypothetical protein
MKCSPPMQFTEPLSRWQHFNAPYCGLGVQCHNFENLNFHDDVLNKNPHATPFKFEIRRRLQFKICVVALGTGGTSKDNKHLGKHSCTNHRWIESLDVPKFPSPYMISIDVNSNAKFLQKNSLGRREVCILLQCHLFVSFV